MATWKIKGRNGELREHTRQLKIVSSELGGLLLQSAYPHTSSAAEGATGLSLTGDSCAFGDGVAELSLAPYELNRLRGALGLGQVEFIDETGLIDAHLSIGRGEDGAPRFIVTLRAREDEPEPRYIDESDDQAPDAPRRGRPPTRPKPGATIGPLFAADSANAPRPAKPAPKRGRPRGKRGRPKSIRPTAA